MMPFEVVIDSNVFISAFLFGGIPKTIILSILEGKTSCSISLALFDEVKEVLQRPKFGLSSDQALSFAEELHSICQLVTPKKHFKVIKDDPDDNTVLDCAFATGANYIISGDAHLLDLESWKGIQILSPTDFLKQVVGQQGT